VLRGPVLLPKLAFVTAWRWSGHGDPPPVVGMDEAWLPADALKRYEERVLDVLTDNGVAAKGSLTPEFRTTLDVLATGPTRFWAWTGDIENDETGGILVSIKDRQAARLLRMDTMIRIDAVDARCAPAALVDALPDVRPARFEPVCVAKSRYRPDADAFFDRADPTSEVPADPAERPRELMAGRRSGIHQLYVAHNGERSSPVTVVDVVGEGRVLTFQSTAGGELLLEFYPGSRENLVAVLENTREGL
jgi:hypothetical protein